MRISMPRTVLLWALAVPLLLRADDWPTLRRTNYVAVLGTAGKPLNISLRSVQRAPQYGDELTYILFGPENNQIAAGDLVLDTDKTIVNAPKKDGLCVLEIETGPNICYVDAGETPLAYIASHRSPLHTIRAIEKLYFYVPENCREFHLNVRADVPREAARIQILSPEGNVFKEKEDDFDKAKAIRVKVPDAWRGRAWAVAVLKPMAADLVLDDVVMWLDPQIPPYLSKREEWALAFGQRKHK
ncbi:MAG: hypothetical protein GXP25_01385 [Planctomycetes bacterium]|nr:hypothetical protein [Planctomycetota bacterium]